MNWLAMRLVAAIRPEIEALRAKQYSYNKNSMHQLVGLGVRLSGIEAKFTGIEEQFIGIKENLVGIEEEFKRIEGQFARNEEQFVRIETQFAGNDARFTKADTRLSEISAAVSAIPEATRAELERRLGEQERALGKRSDASFHDFKQHVEKFLAHSRKHLDASLAEARKHLDVSMADAENKRREETSRQVRAELVPVSNLMTRHFNWSRDTARMVGEVRAEMRLLTAVAEAPASEENGDSGDPLLLRRYMEKSKVREVYPTELFEGIGEVALPIASINEESGHSNQVDLMYVAAIAKVRQARSIFEFGTFIGRTTYHLTFASEDAHVTTLNLPPTDEAMQENLGRMFRQTDREDRVTQLLEDSADFDPTPYAKSMDFIFVDADHSYELVKNDTEKALTMLKPGGAIVWHDYAVKSPGVVTYIQEFAAERPVFRLKHTCLIVYLDGVDAMAFESRQGTSSEGNSEVVSLPSNSIRVGEDDKEKMSA